MTASKALFALVFVPALTLGWASAHADCNVIGYDPVHQENICSTTSDGGGDPYTVDPNYAKQQRVKQRLQRFNDHEKNDPSYIAQLQQDEHEQRVRGILDRARHGQ